MCRDFGVIAFCYNSWNDFLNFTDDHYNFQNSFCNFHFGFFNFQDGSCNFTNNGYNS